MNRVALLGIGLAAALTAHAETLGDVVVADYALPDLDRWNYPFNATPGYRSVISTFSALGQEELQGFTFDQRDAQFVAAWDTAPEIESGLGDAAYCIAAATVRVNVSTDLAFPYDQTYDDYITYIEPGEPGAAPDSDAGRPIELYGAAFRAPWTPETYFEGTSPVPGPPFGPVIASDVRYVYATDFIGGMERDVSNNVRDAFDPRPFAIGTADLAPGADVPSNTTFTFDLDVTDPDIQTYLRESLDRGRLYVSITSLQPASSSGGPGSGDFASWYGRENIFASGRAARLHLEVAIREPGDVNDDGAVNFDDLNLLLANWGQSGAPGVDGDANCDGSVDFDDLNIVLANWDG